MTSTFDPATYRMTVTGKRRMPIRPLLFRVDPPPYRDESLLGILARSPARNGLDRMLHVSRLADHSGQVINAVLSADENFAARLAFVMEVPQTEVGRRMQPVIDRPDIKGEFLDFNGVPVRSAFVERRRRRVSPRALAVAPYHRALHDLRPFSFCTETMETLLDECPVCRQPLDWLRTRGVQFCGHCVDEHEVPTIDLRDHPQPLVDVDGEDIRSLVGLVHPDPDVRARTVARVHPKLRGEPPGDIFNLAMMLGLVLRTEPDAHFTTLMGIRSGGTKVFTPDLLATLGRAVRDWPKSFADVADAMRKSSGQRSQHFGIHKEIGPLRLLATNKSLTPAIRSIVVRAIDDDMKRTAWTTTSARRRRYRHRDDLIDVRAASTMLGTKTGRIARLVQDEVIPSVRLPHRRSTILVPLSVIEDIKIVFDDMVEGTRAARNVGLPLEALEALAEAGRIERATGPAVALSLARVHYRSGSLNGFVDQVLSARGVPDRQAKLLPLDAAIRSLPPGLKPWLRILDAISGGNLSIYSSDRRGPVFTTVLVDTDALGSLVRAAMPDVQQDPEAAVSYREAAGLLGVSTPTVTWMVAAGLLGTTGDHDRRLTHATIADFNRRYAHTAEVAARLGMPIILVRRTMAARGIEPAAALHKGMRLVWRRDQVFA